MTKHERGLIGAAIFWFVTAIVVFAPKWIAGLVVGMLITTLLSTFVYILVSLF